MPSDEGAHDSASRSESAGTFVFVRSLARVLPFGTVHRIPNVIVNTPCIFLGHSTPFVEFPLVESSDEDDKKPAAKPNSANARASMEKALQSAKGRNAARRTDLTPTRGRLRGAKTPQRDGGAVYIPEVPDGKNLPIPKREKPPKHSPFHKNGSR